MMFTRNFMGILWEFYGNRSDAQKPQPPKKGKQTILYKF